MKKLSPLQNLLYMAGGILLVAGAALPLLSSVREAAPYVFSAGAVLFASMQMLARYDGDAGASAACAANSFSEPSCCS